MVDMIGYDKDGHTVYTRLGNGAEATYSYDNKRERLQETELRVGGNSVMANRYDYVADDTTSTEETFFYHSDHLGSTSYITDDKGNITQYDAYLPYGELLVDEHSSSEEMPYKFNGKEMDEETGLYYYGARYMNPKTSLWYGVDPLAEKYVNVSEFCYTKGNPIVFIDPDGMRRWPVNKTYNGHRRRFSNNFGQNRGNHLHKGVDINLGVRDDDYGAPVFATHSGRVVYVKSYKDGNAAGNRIRILSKDGKIATVYMHLSSFADGLKAGVYVEEGQQIGTIGGTGFGKLRGAGCTSPL
jgi:RHS repeat-associated protein